MGKRRKAKDKRLRRKIWNWNYNIKERGGSFRVTTEWVEQFKNCAYCQAILDPSNMSLDHKTPRTLGGTDDASNLHLVCNVCNRAKGSLNHDQFKALVDFLGRPPFTPREKKIVLAKLKLGWRADFGK